MITKSAAPINDPEIIKYLQALESQKLFSHPHPSPAGEFKEEFTSIFTKWMQGSFDFGFDIEDWTPLCTSGTTEDFLDFYLKYKDRQIVFFKGEYPFHGLCGGKPIDRPSDFTTDDAFVISLPFSATGNTHENLTEALDNCEKLGIPVLVDCALINISTPIKIDLSIFTCIDRISFSLSKSFSSGRFRAGLSFHSKTHKHSPLKHLNEWSYLNHLSQNIHIHLMKEFSRDYLWEKYRETQLSTCNELGADPSSTLIFGISKESKYSEYSRSGVINRLCLSQLLVNEN